MTFIVTVLSVEADHAYNRSKVGSLVIEPVPLDNGGSYAGNIAALSNYPGVSTQGRAYALMLDENGYRSSNDFFAYVHGDDEAAVFSVPDSLRPQFAHVLNDLVALSPIREVVVVLEDNGHVTDPELTYEERETIERVGPVTLAEFWQMVDQHRVREDSLVRIQATAHVP